MSYTREQLGEIARGHAMWPEFEPGEWPRAVRCSCGWTYDDTYFDDHVVVTDIKLDGTHPRYLLAFPPDCDDWVVAVQDGTYETLTRTDLAWLLEQPGLPEEFRRAAAQHLPSDA